MRRHWISQLAHVELLTPKPDETLWFFKDLLGMEESAREGQSVYLRRWGEWFHHSLMITEAPQPGMGHAGWRSDDEDTLEEVVKFVQSRGLGDGWTDGHVGHGRAYRYRSPDDHRMEIFWDVEWFQAPPELRSSIKNHPQKYLGRGACIRRIDHVTLMASEVAPCREFAQELGFKYHEGIYADGSEFEIGAWLSVTNHDHDTAYVFDPTAARGRLNHVAFWQDTREEVMRTADILRDQEIFIEFGPYRHGLSEGFFLYVYEPGGNRVEIFSGGYQNWAPDWGPIKWYVSDHPTTYWAGELPQTLFTYGTPIVEMPATGDHAVTEQAAPAGMPRP